MEPNNSSHRGGLMLGQLWIKSLRLLTLIIKSSKPVSASILIRACITYACFRGKARSTELGLLQKQIQQQKPPGKYLHSHPMRIVALNC